MATLDLNWVPSASTPASRLAKRFPASSFVAHVPSSAANRWQPDDQRQELCKQEGTHHAPDLSYSLSPHCPYLHPRYAIPPNPQSTPRKPRRPLQKRCWLL